jgi:hypothetical protein
MDEKNGKIEKEAAEEKGDNTHPPIPVVDTAESGEEGPKGTEHGENATALQQVSRLRKFWKWLSKATAAEAGMFLLTLVIAVSTTCYTKYASKQLETSAEAFRITERPVMVLGRKDGMVAEFKESKNPDTSGIILYFQNSGHLPAINVCVTPDMGNRYQEPWIHGIVRERAKTGIGHFGIGGPACPTIPGDSVYPYRMIIPRKLADEVKNGERAAEHFVGAFVQYCDSFGKYSCSRYAIVYHSDFGDFRNVTQEDCSLRYGEYPPLPDLSANPSMEIIPTPCDQPGDQEKREKALKEWKQQNKIP